MKAYKEGQLIRIKCNSVKVDDTDEKCIGRIISPFEDTPRIEVLFSTAGCDGTCLLFTEDRITKVKRLSSEEVINIFKNKLMGKDLS